MKRDILKWPKSVFDKNELLKDRLQHNISRPSDYQSFDFNKLYNVTEEKYRY